MPVRCTVCNDTGVFETGSNDLPCTCPMGKVALFNTSGVRGPVTGAEMERHFLNSSPDPIPTGREGLDARVLPGRTFNGAMENARRLANSNRSDDWFGWIETYRSAAPLFCCEETYAEGLVIIDKTTPKLLTRPDMPSEIRFVLEGNQDALRVYPLGVCKALRTFAKTMRCFDPETIRTDACNELVWYTLYGLLRDTVKISTFDSHAFVLAKYFADARTALFSTLRTV
jgi:hypothetical protein